MLIRTDAQGTLAIGQLSHSWLSGQLARAWGNERFACVEPREAIALGAEQHDVGWVKADAAPRFNSETGLPRSFLELTVDEHLAIWRDAPEQLMSQSTCAALVVSLHGCSLSELRLRGGSRDSGPLQQHIDSEHARQQRLCASLEISQAQLERIQRQMWTWDGLSLALCNGWQPFIARDVPTADGLLDIELNERGVDSWQLDPWPFEAPRVQVSCEARRLAARYPDEAAMREAFERAATVTLTFTLVAA